jgi:hypothetical protein
VTQEGLLDYEGGFKAKFFNRKLGVNGAIFYYDYSNKQLLTKIIDPLVRTATALANIPKSQVKGAELEVTAVPIEGLHLSSGLTYLDARQALLTSGALARILAEQWRGLCSGVFCSATTAHRAVARCCSVVRTWGSCWMHTSMCWP